MPEEESSEVTRKIWFIISVILIIAGVAYYWAWGIMFGTWNLFARESLGAYVITIVLLGFGILGTVLNRKKR